MVSTESMKKFSAIFLLLITFCLPFFAIEKTIDLTKSFDLSFFLILCLLPGEISKGLNSQALPRLCFILTLLMAKSLGLTLIGLFCLLYYCNKSKYASIFLIISSVLSLSSGHIPTSNLFLQVTLALCAIAYVYEIGIRDNFSLIVFIILISCIPELTIITHDTSVIGAVLIILAIVKSIISTNNTSKELKKDELLFITFYLLIFIKKELEFLVVTLPFLLVFLKSNKSKQTYKSSLVGKDIIAVLAFCCSLCVVLSELTVFIQLGVIAYIFLKKEDIYIRLVNLCSSKNNYLFWTLTLVSFSINFYQGFNNVYP